MRLPTYLSGPSLTITRKTTSARVCTHEPTADCDECAPGSVGETPGWIGRVHHSTDAALRYGLRPQEAPVAREMALGDRSLMPEELEEGDHAAIVSF